MNFVGPMSFPGIGTRLEGTVKGLSIQGKDHVMWPVLDTLGQLLRALKVPAYYVPQARVRRFSNTSLLQSYQGETINMEAHQLTLRGVEGPGGSNSVVARVNLTNNLPMTTACSYSEVGSAPKALNAIISTVGS